MNILVLNSGSSTLKFQLIYRARMYIGAFLACMGGADTIIFTGAIGENSPAIRQLICQDLEWAGLKLDKRSQ
jgi:acetate kinase